MTSNIAEGDGRPTTKDSVRFFSIAIASAAETKIQLELASPAADLTGLPPGDAWRPKRRNLAATDGVLGVISDAGWALARAFSGFDTWPGPSRRSARLEAALDRWRHPMDQDEPPPASSAETSAA